MSKNYLFTKKGKKQFSKLSAKDKQTVAEVAIADAVNKALSKHIPEAIVRGCQLKMNALYERHVKEIDKMATGDKEWICAVESLLSEIRTERLKFVKMMERS